MARNRKRAKERRRAETLSTRPGDLLSPSSRRPGTSPEARRNAPGGQRASERATSADRPGTVGSPDLVGGGDPVGAPDPIAHAAPDAELAAAQLSFGAPDITGELDAPAEEDLAELAEASGSDQPEGSGIAASANGAGAVAVPPRAERAVGHRVSPLERLLTFMRGSWAELHRVQWPDRRQVIQATGVVIGFVIVAGVFLGLSDLAASHLMDWILK